MLQVVVMLVNSNVHKSGDIKKWTSPMLRLGVGDDVFRQTRNFCDNLIVQIDAQERRVQQHDIPHRRRSTDA